MTTAAGMASTVIGAGWVCCWHQLYHCLCHCYTIRAVTTATLQLALFLSLYDQLSLLLMRIKSRHEKMNPKKPFAGPDIATPEDCMGGCLLVSLQSEPT
jgi:hypothetical protein